MNVADIGALSALVWVFATQGAMIWYARTRRAWDVREAITLNLVWALIFGGIAGWTGSSGFVFISMAVFAMIGSSMTILAWAENARRLQRHHVGYIALSKDLRPIEPRPAAPRKRMLRGLAITAALVVLGLRLYLALR